MPIVLNNDQIKSISKQMVLYPDSLIKAQNRVTRTEDDKDAALVKDEENKLFFDSIVDVINRYSEEKKRLDGSGYTVYDEQDLIDSAKDRHLFPPHFPTGWYRLIPKIILSSNGNPPVPYTDILEPTIIDDSQWVLDVIQNGWNDGVNYSSIIGTVTDDTATIPTATAPMGLVGDISVGQHIYLYNGTNFLFALVTDVQTVGPDYVITFRNIAGDLGSSISSGFDLGQSHPGYTENQRLNISGVSDNTLRNNVRDACDDVVNRLEAILNTEKSYLDGNTHIGFTLVNQTGLQSLNDLLDEITSWEGQSGYLRFNDANLASLLAEISTRESFIPTRISDIISNLGSVSQAPDGELSGTGAFDKLMFWVNKRCNIAGGSLSRYYGYDLPLQAAEENLDRLTETQTEFESIYASAPLAQDSEITSLILPVSDTSDFSVSDSIKVFDDDSSIFDRNITSIDTNVSITIDSPLTISVKKSKIARIFKEL